MGQDDAVISPMIILTCIFVLTRERSLIDINLPKSIIELKALVGRKRYNINETYEDLIKSKWH